MNLRAIANGAITSVNPNLPAVLKLNNGYTTDATGKRKSATASIPCHWRGQIAAPYLKTGMS